MMFVVWIWTDILRFHAQISISKFLFRIQELEGEECRPAEDLDDQVNTSNNKV